MNFLLNICELDSISRYTCAEIKSDQLVVAKRSLELEKHPSLGILRLLILVLTKEPRKAAQVLIRIVKMNLIVILSNSRFH